MTLPGLPPPRREVLPVSDGGAAAARAEGRRRQARALGGAALAVVLLGGVLGLALGGGGDRPDRLEVAEDVSPSPPPSPPGPPPARPGLQSGRVVDVGGRPLAGVAVLPADLGRVLTRTARDGGYVVPCGRPLVLAAYAPSVRGGRVRERSPGVGNHAWRRVPEHCGTSRLVVLAPGGVVTGSGTPGADVRVERVRGPGPHVLESGPVFVTRVRPDGTWRVEGLDTGRYAVPGGLVDVREGAASRAPAGG